jgi:hypothetical protein
MKRITHPIISEFQKNASQTIHFISEKNVTFAKKISACIFFSGVLQ